MEMAYARPTSIFDKTYMNQLFQLGYNPACSVSGDPNKVLTLMQPSRIGK